LGLQYKNKRGLWNLQSEVTDIFSGFSDISGYYLLSSSQQEMFLILVFFIIFFY